VQKNVDRSGGSLGQFDRIALHCQIIVLVKAGESESEEKTLEPRKNCHVISIDCFFFMFFFRFLFSCLIYSIFPLRLFKLSVLRARDLLAVARISVTHLHAHHDRFGKKTTTTRQSPQETRKRRRREKTKNNKQILIK
jgi:hypothetical protein